MGLRDLRDLVHRHCLLGLAGPEHPWHQSNQLDLVDPADLQDLLDLRDLVHHHCLQDLAGLERPWHPSNRSGLVDLRDQQVLALRSHQASPSNPVDPRACWTDRTLRAWLTI